MASFMEGYLDYRRDPHAKVGGFLEGESIGGWNGLLALDIIRGWTAVLHLHPHLVLTTQFPSGTNLPYDSWKVFEHL
jgi:hypothetical protein